MIYDFVIVGAGIAGASVAYELARNASVCVLEAESRPGFHSTGRSAALFTPTYGGREIRAVTRASQMFFDQPPANFSEHPLLTPRGCLYIARADQVTRLEEAVGQIRASGGTVSMLDAGQAMARVPLFRSGYLAAAALDSDSRDIDVDAVHQGFLRGARALGAKLVTAAPATTIRRGPGVWSIEVAGETVEAPVIINAAGAWADSVAEACGARRLGLQPMRRTALLVDGPAGIDIRQWPAVIDADEQFYFKPDRTQLLISPADEIPQPPGDAQPDDLDVAIGVDRVQQALDIDVRRVSHRWAGLRTFAPDRVPVMGFDSQVKGLFWCAGQGGYGIQTAPAMARIAAALARGEAIPADVAAEGLIAEDLSPARFHAVAGAEAVEE
jgi:D-arginine dehydrogenase